METEQIHTRRPDKGFKSAVFKIGRYNNTVNQSAEKTAVRG